MKRIIRLIGIIAIIVNCQLSIVNSQSLTPKVTPTSGGYTTGGGNSLSWTMGETHTLTLQGSSNILTQGQQQPEIDILTGTVSTAFCQGATLTVPYTAKGYFGTANVFTAQLSNSSGSFASPVSIGTYTGRISGNIPATIPSNTVSGNGYRIRVVSNASAYNGKDNGTNITINANPTTSSSVTTTIACYGNNGVITVAASGGTTPYSGTGTHSVVAGTYSYTVSDNNGCTSTTSTTITQPSASVTFTTVVTNNSSCTTVHTASISVTATGGTGTKTYSDNGGTSYQGASLFSSLATGTYTVKVKDANGCLSAASSIAVSTSSGITFTTAVVNATTCSTANGKITVTATGGAGVFNYSKDGGTTYQSSNIFNLMLAGTYSIKVKDPLGCYSSVTPVHVSANTGGCRTMEENSIASSNTFTVYPNPASDKITVMFSSDKVSNYTLKIVDISGRIIFNEGLNGGVGENQFELNLSTIAKGVYMILLESDNGIMQKKIIVE